MPFLKGISNKYQFQISTNFKSLNGNWKFKEGFTLVEILLSLFVIMAIVSIILVVSSTYLHSRRSSLQAIATGIASRDIENLRLADFNSVQTGNITDSELSLLPSSSAARTVANFETNAKIKQVTVTVGWIEKGLAQEIKLDTLISQNGI